MNPSVNTTSVSPGTMETAGGSCRAETRALAGLPVWPYHFVMAGLTIRTTYALDAETVRLLDRMARRWKDSKSEALRRAIRAASGRDFQGTDDRVEAFLGLRRALDLKAPDARRWERDVRAERRAGARAKRKSPS